MSQGMTKSSKILQFVNYRMRVTISDGRAMVGKFMAFDKHMNIVLGDCEEFRRIPVRGGKGEEQEQRRTLGFVILRGESVVSLTVESKPPAEDKKKVATAGPGVGVPGGRGLPVAPMGQAPAGLAGPARGVGGPGAAQMAPQGRGYSAPPQMVCVCVCVCVCARARGRSATMSLLSYVCLRASACLTLPSPRASLTCGPVLVSVWASPFSLLSCMSSTGWKGWASSPGSSGGSWWSPTWYGWSSSRYTHIHIYMCH
jgi:small nuclear ribonucleoprotein (snRNP)-like protein